MPVGGTTSCTGRTTILIPLFLLVIFKNIFYSKITLNSDDFTFFCIRVHRKRISRFFSILLHQKSIVLGWYHICVLREWELQTTHKDTIQLKWRKLNRGECFMWIFSLFSMNRCWDYEKHQFKWTKKPIIKNFYFLMKNIFIDIDLFHNIDQSTRVMPHVCR